MQLPLSLTLVPDLSLDNYVPGDNGLLLHSLSALTNAQDTNKSQIIYLWGGPGVGKTHLTHGVANACSDNQRSVFVLDCASVLPMLLDAPEDALGNTLMGLEEYSLVCLDNLHLLFPNLAWQRAVFDLINRVIEANNHLLLTSTLPPQSTDITLPDLRSRLCWGQVYQVQALSDENTLVVLQQSISARGIKLQDNALNFLLKHVPRDMHSLKKLIDGLDELSLIEQKGITIPLIKQYLNV